MQDSLEVVSLTRVLAIKELQEAIYEICWNVLDDSVMT